MKTRLVALSCASLLAACAGKPAAETPAAPGAAAPAALHRVDELVIVPEKAAPEGLSAAEKGELSGPCMPLFTAMIEGVRRPAIERGLMSAADFDRGIAELYRTAGGGGTFCYTFFKAIARLGPA